MKNRTTTWLTGLTLAYLIVEVQAWSFMSQLYQRHLSVELLSQFERFGYASVGLGITLLYARFVANHYQTKKLRLCAWLLSPAIYAIGVWGAYETVHKIPSLLNNDAKAYATRQAVHTMGVPGWGNLLPQTNTHSTLKNAISSMQLHYPTPDNVVQGTYIQGLRNTAAFHRYFYSHADKMQKELWALTYAKARRTAFASESLPLNREERAAHLSAHANFAQYTKNDPVLTPVNYIYRQALAKRDPATLLLWEDKGYLPSSLSDHESAAYRESMIDAYAWDLLGDKFSDWPAYPIHNKNEPLSQIQSAYSYMVLSPYAHLPGVSIPWDSRHNQDRIYFQALRQVSPFLFDSTGTPLISLHKVYQESSRLRYIDTLVVSLPEVVRSQWNSYQHRALTTLATTPEAWSSPASKTLHQDVIRIGAVVPVMLIVSSVLILLNLTLLMRKSKIAGMAGVGITAAVLAIKNEMIHQAILNAVLIISVNEAQIFLH